MSSPDDFATSPAPSGAPQSPDRLVRAVVIGVVTFISLVVTLWFTYQLRSYLAVLLLGIVVGTTLGPLVDALARYHIPRILSGFLVYALLMAGLSLFLAYAIPQLAEEGAELLDRVDEFQRVYEDLAEVSPLPPWEELGPFVQERLSGFTSQLVGQIASQAGAVVTAVIYTFTVFVVGLFWTITREPSRELFLSLLRANHRERADHTLAVLGSTMRHYILAEFAGMLVVGILTYIALRLMGMPFAFVLAAIAFVLEILPILGPWIAFVPALLVALSEGLQTTILVCVFYLALQQVESNVIVPLFQGRWTGLPQLLVLYAVLLGGAFMGVLGALIAIPVAIIAHTLFMEIFVPWRRAQVDASGQLELPASNATTPLDRPASREAGGAEG